MKIKCYKSEPYGFNNNVVIFILKQTILFYFIQMAASTADCNVMEKELDTLQSQKQGRRVAR